MQPTTYSDEVSLQMPPSLQTQVQQQTGIAPDAFKFSTNVTQRSFSLPSPHTASVA